MAKKQFKAESKRLLDMMINSIYTHKEIFLRRTYQQCERRHRQAVFPQPDRRLRKAEKEGLLHPAGSR